MKLSKVVNIKMNKSIVAGFTMECYSYTEMGGKYFSMLNMYKTHKFGRTLDAKENTHVIPHAFSSLFSKTVLKHVEIGHSFTISKYD